MKSYDITYNVSSKMDRIRGVYTVQSENIRGVYYAAEDSHLLMYIGNRAYLMLLDEAEELAEELKAVIEDYKDTKRYRTDLRLFEHSVREKDPN